VKTEFTGDQEVRNVRNPALDWALRQDLKPIPKFILTVMADAVNGEGICWPRISVLAQKTGVSARTVQRSLQLLVSRGLITIEPRHRSDGSRSSNRYRLHLDRGVRDLSASAL
jgi:DNA-binding transcriptional MocR family regulator